MSEREQIENLENQLTGVFFDDLYLIQNINYLKRNIKNNEVEIITTCNLDDEFCLNCGS